MTCQRIDSELDAYLGGALDAARVRALEEHVAECPACAQRLAAARALHGARPDKGSSGLFADSAAQKTAAEPPRLIAAGFLGAFALSIVTVVLTGLWVRSPVSKRDDASPAVSLAIGEQRTLNLVFDSALTLDDVALTVDLPDGVRLAGHDGAQVATRTRLTAGDNVLPLELVGVANGGGELVARLQLDGMEKVFIVNVAVGRAALPKWLQPPERPPDSVR